MKRINWLSNYGNRGIYRDFIDFFQDFYRQNFLKYNELVRLYFNDFYYSIYYLPPSVLKDKENLEMIEGHIMINLSNYDFGVISFPHNNLGCYMIFRNLDEYRVCKKILEIFYENVEQS